MHAMPWQNNPSRVVDAVRSTDRPMRGVVGGKSLAPAPLHAHGAVSVREASLFRSWCSASVGRGARGKVHLHRGRHTKSYCEGAKEVGPSRGARTSFSLCSRRAHVPYMSPAAAAPGSGGVVSSTVVVYRGAASSPQS